MLARIHAKRTSAVRTVAQLQYRCRSVRLVILRQMAGGAFNFSVG